VIGHYTTDKRELLIKKWKREGEDRDVEDVEEAFNQWFSIKIG
jgi:hypothetical protein